MARGQSVPGGRGSFTTDKVAITAACHALIENVLKPRFLPEIRPTELNYPIDIRGRWFGTGFRFIQRYRSGYPDNAGSEFDPPVTRLEYVARDRFDLSYMRHIGRWHRLYGGVSLAKALRLIENDGHLHPN